MDAEDEKYIRELRGGLPGENDRDPFQAQRGVRPALREYPDQQAGWLLLSRTFREAADELTTALAAPPKQHKARHLFYPIFYLYRHHLELELKALANLGDEQVANEHGLERLWKGVKNSWPRCDGWAQPEQKATFEARLAAIDLHDPKSMAARYPVDNSQQPMLTALDCVDLQALRTCIDTMNEYLSCVYEYIAEQIEWQRGGS